MLNIYLLYLATRALNFIETKLAGRRTLNYADICGGTSTYGCSSEIHILY
jgi:hypothetical protein